MMSLEGTQNKTRLGANAILGVSMATANAAGDTDWEAWKRLRDKLGHRVQSIGDDLFTTRISRIHHGISRQAPNSVLIKLNQIGTVSETLDAIYLTTEAGWLPLVSARSGETEDAFISHLAIATNAGQLKAGSFARSERMVKCNEVIRIAHHLGNRARFLGAGIYDRIFAPSKGNGETRKEIQKWTT